MYALSRAHIIDINTVANSSDAVRNTFISLKIMTV